MPSQRRLVVALLSMPTPLADCPSISSAHLVPARAIWKVAIRSRVAQAHATATTAADCNPLQKSGALARHAGVSRLVAVDVVCQSPLVGHEVLPANLTRMSGLEANRPVRDCHLDGSPD